VSVLLKREGDIVKIVVEDEGPGIPVDEMHKLFTDFGKTSVQPTGNETSTGLGLSICKKIVESHHGKIYAGNRQGSSTGAVFTIEFDVNKLAVGV
jgi:K+-sensing histidine kinase KdpD